LSAPRNTCRFHTSMLSAGRPLAVWQGPFCAASHAEFVSEYWQKRPLLIKGMLAPKAVENFCPLSVDDLCQLSIRPDCSSRLVRERGGVRPWECRRGPFTEDDLGSLPRDDTSLPWTLLVSGVDRALEPVEALREDTELWGFTPRWRVDDVQVSHAPLGGSIGAHVDNCASRSHLPNLLHGLSSTLAPAIPVPAGPHDQPTRSPCHLCAFGRRRIPAAGSRHTPVEHRRRDAQPRGRDPAPRPGRAHPAAL
jgi:hypothetical protein